jgi:predicted ATPase
MMNNLWKIELEGYKSIKSLSLELKQLNVMIGANGAGKSNLISFFKLLNEMMGERLQEFISVSGFAQSLLYYGAKVTPQITARLFFNLDDDQDIYQLRLFHAAGDTLIFAEEKLSYQRKGYLTPKSMDFGAGYLETKLKQKADDDIPPAKIFRHLLNSCRVYQFHDTSRTSPIRQPAYINADKFLYPDAGNLSAVLYKIKNANEVYYRKIVDTIRLVVPFFRDFVLEPSSTNNQYIILNWQDIYSDMIFGPHQLSDGTLRAMALLALLLQPEEDLPILIILDEPELGLHPQGLAVLASIMKQVAHQSQLIVGTQSAILLDFFDPEDVVVVDRKNGISTFTRLEEEKLHEWLNEYSLSELWEKNVIGGGPF